MSLLSSARNYTPSSVSSAIELAAADSLSQASPGLTVFQFAMSGLSQYRG